ncbi:hypothetical protein AX14_007653 [Amanita brunnescens Koide BX004]|nr:hypothetical protein AX14_007653 [Amanita brunnescens Koide BX004]
MATFAEKLFQRPSRRQHESRNPIGKSQESVKRFSRICCLDAKFIGAYFNFWPFHMHNEVHTSLFSERHTTGGRNSLSCLGTSNTTTKHTTPSIQNRAETLDVLVEDRAVIDAIVELSKRWQISGLVNLH